jgi:hypothetical protein
MTLAHTIARFRLSTFSTRLDDWPEFTVFRGTDIRVAGVSLCRLVDEVGTPCVRTAAAVIPGSGGHPADRGFASVLVTRVLRVKHRRDGGLDAWVDANLHHCVPVLGETRLLGRLSTAKVTRVAVHSTHAAPSVGDAVRLPGDLCPDDLLVIPCVGATGLFDVRSRS